MRSKWVGLVLAVLALVWGLGRGEAVGRADVRPTPTAAPTARPTPTAGPVATPTLTPTPGGEVGEWRVYIPLCLVESME